MIKGVVFSNQYVSAAAHASLFRMMVKDGIIRGCGFVFAPNNQSNAVQIMDGMFVLCGRVVEIQGQEIILTDETNTKPYIRIRGVIDMTKASTKEVFEQFSFKVDPNRDYADNITDFDSLTKEDINSPQYSNSGKYEVEFAILKCANGKPTSTARTLPSASGEGGSGETEGSGPPAFTYKVTNNGTTTSYTYTPDPTNLNHTEAGIFEVIDDGDSNWRVKFLTSGVLVVNEINGMANGINVFLVGGGGGGATGGGGGGYTKTGEFTNVVAQIEYPIVIGAGGANASNGEASTAFEFTADGGKGASGNRGGNGGSGGGTYLTGVSASSVPKKDANNYRTGGENGSNGFGSGINNGVEYGKGQGTDVTTREFGESAGAIYAGGGGSAFFESNASEATGAYGGEGGGGHSGGGVTAPGTPNTGGGGGGGPGNSKSGGSGIVIIRNKRTA